MSFPRKAPAKFLHVMFACNRYCNTLVGTPILYADADFCSFFGILHEAGDTPESLLQVFSRNADKCRPCHAALKFNEM